MENNSGCLVCGQNMMQSDGCRVAVMYHCGEQYVRIPFRGFRGERCETVMHYLAITTIGAVIWNDALCAVDSS